MPPGPSGAQPVVPGQILAVLSIGALVYSVLSLGNGLTARPAPAGEEYAGEMCFRPLVG
jgi:hypothetical protein